MFKYAPFNASQQLKQASKNNPPLKRGSRGLGVQLVEVAFKELGYKLSLSFRKDVPDGIFGKEVKSVTEQFQVDHRNVLGPGKPLKNDGILGRNSMEALDLVIAKHNKTNTSKPKQKPKTKAPLPSTQEYQIGKKDPQFKPDPGAGKWNSDPTQLSYIVLRSQILNLLPHAYFIIGPDAATHMYHYLQGSGKDYTIDLEGMVKSVRSATELFEEEVAQAQYFVEKLPPGEHDITSRILNLGYNEQEKNRNWYFAIGGYAVWGKGTAKIIEDKGKRRYELLFEYRFRDRYNWDAGKQVEFLGITVTDEFMAEFHRQGLAREFDCYGRLRRNLNWIHGEGIPRKQIQAPGGR